MPLRYTCCASPGDLLRIISLQDGQFGASCNVSHPIVAYLAQHYDGGRILIDEYHSQIDLSSANIPFRNEIYEGDGASWSAALQSPSKYVEWIITGPHDLITQHIDTHSAAFLRQYSPMVEESVTGMQLWHVTNSPPLPSRAVPDDVIAPYLACNHAKGMPMARATGAPVTFTPPAEILPDHRLPRFVSGHSTPADKEDA
jgi:hypothetical protein